MAATPVDTHVQRWGGGLPQYAVGHLDRVARIRAAVALSTVALPGSPVRSDVRRRGHPRRDRLRAPGGAEVTPRLKRCPVVPGRRDNGPDTLGSSKPHPSQKAEMTTHVTTHNPVRSDLPTPPRTHPAATAPAPGPSPASVPASPASAPSSPPSMVNAVYDDEFAGNSTAIADKLADQTGPMFAFHIFAMLGAVLLVVFAAGLFRRLRAPSRRRLAPLIAFVGLLGTASSLLMGTGLDTEFISRFVHGEATSSTPPTRRSTTTGSAPSRGAGCSPACPASRSTSAAPAASRAGSAGSVWSSAASPCCSASRRCSTWPA